MEKKTEAIVMKYPDMQMDKRKIKELFHADMEAVETLQREAYIQTGNKMSKQKYEEVQRQHASAGKAAEYVKSRLMKTVCAKYGIIEEDSVQILDIEEFEERFGKFFRTIYPADSKMGKLFHTACTDQNLDEWKFKMVKGGKMIDNEKRILNFAREPSRIFKEIEFDEQTKELGTRFFTYVHDVLCSRNKEQYEYLLDWLSLVLKMEQTSVILVLYTRLEGTGKSHFIEFAKKLLGTLATQLTTGVASGGDQFTYNLMGRSLLYLEELDEHDHIMKDKVLNFCKAYSTSSTWQYRRMRKELPEIDNFGNIAMTLNFTIDLKGRRVFCPDVSTERVRDKEYYSALNQTLENDLAIQFIFNQLWKRKITISEFKKMELMTNAKEDYIDATVRSSVRFLKEKYILDGKDIPKMKRKAFYDEYVDWCHSKRMAEKQIQAIQTFSKEMTEFGVTNTKTRFDGETGVNVISGKCEDIAKILKKVTFLKDADYVEHREEQKEKEEERESMQNGVVAVEHEQTRPQKIQMLKNQIELLQKQLRELETQETISLWKKDAEIITEDDVLCKFMSHLRNNKNNTVTFQTL